MWVTGGVAVVAVCGALRCLSGPEAARAEAPVAAATNRAAAKAAKLDVETKAELKKLGELGRRYKFLKEENELLTKAIRFASDRRRKSSRSSSQTGRSTQSR